MPSGDLAEWIAFVRRPDWFDYAACRDLPTELFFPLGDDARGLRNRPSSRRRDQRIAEARAVCAGCAVRSDCLAYGLHEPAGVWGGRSTEERAAIREHVERGSR